MGYAFTADLSDSRPGRGPGRRGGQRRRHRPRPVCGSARSAGRGLSRHPRSVEAGSGADEPGGQGGARPRRGAARRWPARGRDGRGERLLRRGEPRGHLLQRRGGGRGRALLLLRVRRRPTPGATTTGNRAWASAPAATRRSSTPRPPGPRPGRRPRLFWARGPARPAATPWSSRREVAAALLSYVAQGLSADAVQKGRSLVRRQARRDGRLRRWSTLVDDGLAPGGMATNPFDGEGSAPAAHAAARRRGAAGVFTQQLYSAQGRRQAPFPRATPSEARTVRGPGWRPPTWSSRRARARSTTCSARVGTGLYVENAAGLHSGVNVISGEISVGVTGRLDRERGPRRGRCARSPSPPISCRFLSSVERPGRQTRAGSRSTGACARRRWRWRG